MAPTKKTIKSIKSSHLLEDDEIEIPTNTITAKKAASMKLLELIEQVDDILSEEHLSEESIAQADIPLSELEKRMSLRRAESIMFCSFISMFSDPRISVCDISRFFRCSPVRICSLWDAILSLREKGLVRMIRNEGNETFHVPSAVMVALRKNEVFRKPDDKNLTQDAFFERMGELHSLAQDRNISSNEFVREAQALMNNNMHIPFAEEVVKAGLDTDSLLILIGTAMMLIEDGDEHIILPDVEDLFETARQVRLAVRQISEGRHELQKKHFIEPALENGMASTSAWHLTDQAKKVLLPGVQLLTSQRRSSSELRSPETITEKKLFFRPETQEQVNRLRHIFSEEHFRKVQERLKAHGMRQGMACVFYGGPGTGKTELVHQLAKETGRAIMLVDISQMRDKFVGETEKQIKNVFDRYRAYVREQPIAPILVFNEADALFCNRNSNATTGVDKMENAMQNIILQEMENLDGILIATTNLAESMDSAFERRFLYKVEFQNPGPEEAMHIWRTMLPELQETDALALAKQYRFSGGQIENIARKQLVDSILSCDDEPDYADMLGRIEDACKQEQFRRKGCTRMGFAG